MRVEEFLRAVTEASGVSGHEGSVAGVIKRAWEGLADEVRVDTMGNLIARLVPGQGSDPLRVMIAAHMDEIGLMVTKIEEGGFLRFTSVGGFDRRVLPGQEVHVHIQATARELLPAEEQVLLGVIGVKPPHLLPREDMDKPYKPEDMYIDTGLGEAEVRRLVQVGDAVTVCGPYQPLRGEMVASKALDDRAGVGVLHVCLHELVRLHRPHDVFLVATVQEEVGLKGAVTSVFGLAPDVGVAVDVDFADQPGVPEERAASLEGGPVLPVGPNIHPLVFSVLQNVAREEGIPHQVRAMPGESGTDAWAIQVTREGIPTALVGIPLRYMHTSVEVVSVNDIKRAGRLLARFVMALETSALRGWRWEQ